MINSRADGCASSLNVCSRKYYLLFCYGQCARLAAWRFIKVVIDRSLLL